VSSTVYINYSQDQLDAQYDQRTLVADVAPYFERWQQEGRRVAARLGPGTSASYGGDPSEVIEFFRPPVPARGLHLHYHGGAWRALTSRDAWFIAPPWVAAGFTFASVNFGLVPEVSLATQVRQARCALAWCHANASAIEVDPAQITISGHSSGAYLAAMVSLADWGCPQPDVQAVIIASGVYDLEPVQLSARNAYLRLNENEALMLSPVRHLRKYTPPCSVLWSTNELDEFQRQSVHCARALEQRGRVQHHPVDVPNHFDTWDLVTPDLII
jgi:arylformamidase